MRRLAAIAFWLVFGLPFAALFTALWLLALMPGTIIAWIVSGDAENAWIICAPLMFLADAVGYWAAGDDW